MEAYFAEDEGIGALLGFQDLNHVFAVGPHDQQFQQAMALMLNNGGMKQIPGSPARSHTDSPLSSLLHKIEHLQGLLLQLAAQAGVNNNQRMATATTGIEKLVDQLMVVAKGMLVQQSEQQAVLLPSENASSAAAFNNYWNDSSSNPFVEDFSCLRDFAPTEKALVTEQLQQQEKQQYISYLASLADEVQDPVLLVAGPAAAAAAAAAAAKEEEEEAEGDSLPPGSYDLIELDAMEILAEHTHFCEICGKGFKRDANLRMHMRGHGDEYKTAAALARPDKADSQQQQEEETRKRYSCPFLGCKRNKLHAKFLPLKTVLCVKNHYRRTHCPKMLTCSKCRAKRFSVVADLRTHEKHCGREKWQCSCGTTFSRKDKLLGHLGLFLGHKPVMPGSRFGPAPPRLRYNNVVNGVVQQQHVHAGNSSNFEQGSVSVESWRSILTRG